MKPMKYVVKISERSYFYGLRTEHSDSGSDSDFSELADFITGRKNKDNVQQ